MFRNAGNGKEIAVKRLFGVDEYDIIGTVISLSATKLTLNCDVAGEAVKALRHVVRVKLDKTLDFIKNRIYNNCKFGLNPPQRTRLYIPAFQRVAAWCKAIRRV